MRTLTILRPQSSVCICGVVPRIKTKKILEMSKILYKVLATRVNVSVKKRNSGQRKATIRKSKLKVRKW